VLDSGTGRLVAVDPVTGRVETVAELPGYTRGLALHDQFAFVGLSRIRETSTFGGVSATFLNVTGTTASSTIANGLLVSGGVATNLGAAGAPGYSFIGDSNTGLFSSGADTLNFATTQINVLDRIFPSPASQVTGVVNLLALLCTCAIRADTQGGSPAARQFSTTETRTLYAALERVYAPFPWDAPLPAAAAPRLEDLCTALDDLGTPTGPERRLVPEAGIPFRAVRAGGEGI